MNRQVSCACGCGVRFAARDSLNRPRRYVSGHNPQSSPTIEAIMSALAEGPKERSEMLVRVGRPKRAVATCLSKLKRWGLVFNYPHGVWQRTPGEA